MLTLIFAVFAASLLGSFHCACMCGPIAIWSSAAGTGSSRIDLTIRVVGYHFGRLFTYLTLGIVAGFIGHAIGLIGEGAGVQSAAARIVGALLIGIGGWRLLALWRPNLVRQSSIGWLAIFADSIAKLIATARPHISKQPLIMRSVGIGAITVLLPCGWLYLFVLFAAGTGSVLAAMCVMAAFWLGSIPSLVAVVLGALSLRNASRKGLPRLMPMIGAMIIILFGIHTATGRADADMLYWKCEMTAMMDRNDDAASVLDDIRGQPLPCCQHAK